MFTSTKISNSTNGQTAIQLWAAEPKRSSKHLLSQLVDSVLSTQYSTAIQLKRPSLRIQTFGASKFQRSTRVPIQNSSFKMDCPIMVPPPVSMAHPVKSREILSKGEIFNDDMVFDYVELIWTENSQIYQSKIYSREFDLDELEGELRPKKQVYAPWRNDITEAPTPLPSDSYIKMPYWRCFGANHSKLTNAEIDIMEILLKSPHPNIVEYRGCVREGDLNMGICLRKYTRTLEDFIEGKVPDDQRPPFDHDIIISGIWAGLDLIHSLGLVHDDIKPGNIMLDDEGHAVIIDFDSCTRIGEESRGGTPGWSKKPTLALIENDEHGLDLVTKFIRSEYNGQNYDGHW